MDEELVVGDIVRKAKAKGRPRLGTINFINEMGEVTIAWKTSGTVETGIKLEDLVRVTPKE